MADTRLPSIAEILEATDVLSSQSGARVVKVRDVFVVKYGGRVSLSEAETMCYVSANSDVPVPKVLGTMTDPENTKVNYIIMEFVEGQCLDTIWSDLSAMEQEDVKAQLKAAVDSMRLMPDQGYIGSVGHRKCFDGVFITSDPDATSVNGPFTSEIKMNEGMLSRLSETEPPSSIRLFREILANLPDHKTVFTHADLQARNILVKRGDHGTADHGKIKLTIIDWEYSGWYPEYWEFCNSLIFNAFRTEWLDIVQDTLDVYTNEYLLMQKIRNILFY
jgi:tRNA A-37 threonylcarbamoyl transferase component Bud32